MGVKQKSDNRDESNKTDGEVGPYRRALPQFLATSAKNLILLDLGMTLAFPTLIIHALKEANLQKEGFFLDDSQASWFGSIAFICQPVGSIISGTLLEPLGRRNAMILVNIPHLLGWILFYKASSLTMLFLASIITGLGVGFMEAPVITYVGEICEPRLRGMLTSYSGIFVTVGMVIEYLLSTQFAWKTVALYSSVVPIITIIALLQVPETPMWLLSKGRDADAEKALCWLRGWVKPANVRKELNELKDYSQMSKWVEAPKNPKNAKGYENDICVISTENLSKVTRENCDNNNDEKCVSETCPDLKVSENRKPNFKEKMIDLMRPEMRKPFVLVVSLFVFHNGSGFPAIRPYMGEIFDQELRFPIDSHWAMVVVSATGFLGVLVCTATVRWTGKRKLLLSSMAGCAIGMATLGIWSWSFAHAPAKVESWYTLCMFVIYSFSFSFGLAPVPWMVVSEIFPFRGRGFASGAAAALSYIMGFATSKTFLFLKSHIGLAGIFAVYGTITTVGIVYLYFKLPETEGRSLESIEVFYKNKISKANNPGEKNQKLKIPK